MKHLLTRTTKKSRRFEAGFPTFTNFFFIRIYIYFLKLCLIKNKKKFGVKTLFCPTLQLENFPLRVFNIRSIKEVSPWREIGTTSSFLAQKNKRKKYSRKKSYLKIARGFSVQYQRWFSQSNPIGLKSDR
jgi:hypothetical protein